MKKARSLKEITPTEVNRTVGPDCDIQPPNGHTCWRSYLSTTNKAPAPYKSWLEFRLFTYGALSEVPYEELEVAYVEQRDRVYHPDGHLSGGILLEVKGRFYDRDEANKYLHVRSCLPLHSELIFIFANEGTTFPGASKRVNGSKLTQEEWAKRHNFRYFFATDPCLEAKLRYL